MTLLPDTATHTIDFLSAVQTDFFVRRGRKNAVSRVELSFDSRGDLVTSSSLVRNVTTDVGEYEEVSGENDR